MEYSYVIIPLLSVALIFPQKCVYLKRVEFFPGYLVNVSMKSQDSQGPWVNCIVLYSVQPHGPVTLCISIKPAMIHQIVSKWGCKPFWGNSLVLMRAASPAPECWHCIDAYVQCKWSLRVSYTHIHTHVIETATTLIDQEQQTVSSCHTEGGLIVQTVIRLSSKWD